MSEMSCRDARDRREIEKEQIWQRDSVTAAAAWQHLS